MLVDDEGQPRLADFGLAQIADSQAGRSTFHGRGSMRWQAPELLRIVDNPDGEEIVTVTTTMSDVYAFACVCLEVRVFFPIKCRALTSP